MQAALENGSGASRPGQRNGQYVLLCRHAPHDNGRLKRKSPTADPAPSADALDSTPVGATEYPTQDVARVLREELLYKGEIKLRALLYAPTPESIATAALLRCGLALDESLREPPDGLPLETTGQNARIATTEPDRDAEIEDQTYRLKQCIQFNPALRTAKSNLVNAQQCIAYYLENEELNGNAVLVVGHQPQLSWLSDQLTGGHGLRQWRRLQWWCYGPIPIGSGRSSVCE